MNNHLYMKERKNMTSKANVLRLLLQEAKKQNLKWLVQQSGENLFPNEDDPDDYDNWQFTNKINGTVDFVENIYNQAVIIFSDHKWVKYIKQYDEHSAEDISDYIVCDWIDNFCDRLTETHS